MAQLGDITSTEKLLKVIRSKEELGSAPAEPPPKQSGTVKPPKKNSIPSGKSSTVGIDIGHEYLRIVRTETGLLGSRQIIDRRRFAIPPETPVDSPQFAAFLKSSLLSACGSPKQSDLWAIMSSANVELRSVRIPKVARKQVRNAVYWTAKKEVPFDEKEMVFDFEVQGEVVEQGVPKLAVMFYTAPIRDVENLRKLFLSIGWPLTGISIVPFAGQNLFRSGWMSVEEGTHTSLFIGNDFSRIDVYSGGNLIMTRGIKAGISSMAESLIGQYSYSKYMESAPLTPEDARKILLSISPDTPDSQKTYADFGLTEDKVFEMIQPALDRLARQVERTFENFATIHGDQKIERIFISCSINIYPPMVEYVGAQLGIATEVLDPLSAKDSIAVCRDVDDTGCLSERIAFAPALGIALSDNANTPNLMFTSREKESEEKVKLINRAVFAGMAIIFLICAGFFFTRVQAIEQKKKVIAGLETELAKIGKPVDRSELKKMTDEINKRKELSKVYADRYLGMVLIGEITALTPENIRLLDMKSNISFTKAGAPAKLAGQDSKTARVEEMILEGIILSERQKLEATLASYIITLEASPIFSQVTLGKNSVIYYVKGEVLHFILNLKVEESIHG